MSYQQYPRSVLSPRRVIAEPVPATTGGGRGITAVEEIVSFDAGYWQIDLQEIPLASTQQKLAWRALSAYLGGRLNIVDVPLYLGFLSPWPVDAYGDPITLERALFADGTSFSDETFFDDGTIAGTFVTAAALGAVEVTLFLLSAASVLQPGMDFSVQGATLSRLYRIQQIVNQISMPTGIQYDIILNFPLREAVAARTVTNFEDPRCSCRLLDDQQMRSGADDYAARTLASISFVEALG